MNARERAEKMVGIIKEIRDDYEQEIKEAVAQERERCLAITKKAKESMTDNWRFKDEPKDGFDNGWFSCAVSIAKAIRKRGDG